MIIQSREKSVMREQPATETHSSRVVTVLSVSPDDQDHRHLQSIFEHSNWKLHKAGSLAAALEILRRHEVPVVLCECDLKPGTWKELLEHCESAPNPPTVIVASRLADNYLWSEVLNLGGYDVLSKPFQKEEVFRSLSLAWLHWKNLFRFPRPAPALQAMKAAS